MAIKMNALQFPPKIASLISDRTYQADDIGMSDASVFLFQDKVLKIQKDDEEAENEYRMMTWLRGRLPVPEVFAFEKNGQKSWLLMGRCPGEAACSEKYMLHPEKQAALLAQGLKNLWRVNIADCPSDCRLKHKLVQAGYHVEHGLVDMENTEPGTFGKDGFRNPEELLNWLYANQPEEEPVLSHGDFCLPNIFFSELGAKCAAETQISYIDLGKSGIADKWCDIALCYRSLSHNYSGAYHGRAYAGLDDRLLFRELGLEPDWDKIRYYILLDELF